MKRIVASIALAIAASTLTVAAHADTVKVPDDFHVTSASGNDHDGYALSFSDGSRIHTLSLADTLAQCADHECKASVKRRFARLHDEAVLSSIPHNLRV